MPEFTADELAQWTGGSWSIEPVQRIQGFSIDSRTIAAGELFVAVRAERDGHGFMETAIARGAVAALVDHWIEGLEFPQLRVSDTVRGLQDCAREWRTRFKGTVIGLTGSCGKTSTKEMLRLLLERRGVYATEGNLNNYLGAALSILKLDSSIHQYGVIELGINRIGEMDTLAAMLRPDVGIVTMVGPAHLEGLGSIEGVADEKSKMLESISAGGFAVYPESCLRFSAFQRRAKDASGDILLMEKARGVRYEAKEFSTNYTQLESVDSNAWSADSNACTEGAIELQLPFGARSPLYLTIEEGSLGMRSNWTLAAVVATKLGIERAEIEAASRGWKPGKNRGEVMSCGEITYFLDGYNANPASMLDSMDYFKQRFVGLPHLWVIGGMHELGAASEAWHETVGTALRLGAEDRAVFVGDFGSALREGALKAGNDPARMAQVEKTEAVGELLKGFKGAVFLKGSRFYRMESLVEGAKKKEVGAC